MRPPLVLLILIIMEPGMYLIVNAIVVILLVMSIMFLRKGSTSKTKLNLRQGSGNVPADPRRPQFSDFDGNARSLNVVFQHEGEWFDAYEVLELPAGANGPMVKSQFENLIKGADSKRSKLLQSAFEALFNQGRV